LGFYPDPKANPDGVADNGEAVADNGEAVADNGNTTNNDGNTTNNDGNTGNSGTADPDGGTDEGPPPRGGGGAGSAPSAVGSVAGSFGSASDVSGAVGSVPSSGGSGWGDNGGSESAPVQLVSGAVASSSGGDAGDIQHHGDGRSLRQHWAGRNLPNQPDDIQHHGDGGSLRQHWAGRIHPDQPDHHGDGGSFRQHRPHRIHPDQPAGHPGGGATLDLRAGAQASRAPQRGLYPGSGLPHRGRATTPKGAGGAIGDPRYPGTQVARHAGGADKRNQTGAGASQHHRTRGAAQLIDSASQPTSRLHQRSTELRHRVDRLKRLRRIPVVCRSLSAPWAVSQNPQEVSLYPCRAGISADLHVSSCAASRVIAPGYG
jgi:hypothetical protein